MSRARIAIIGAGPAGLTAALAAARLNLRVVVFEQATDFTRIGGGIVIQSNGLRVLEALGLLDSLRDSMHLCDQFLLGLSGGRYWLTSRTAELSIPHPHIAVIMRYQLQDVLLGAASRQGIPIRFDHRCVGVSIERGRARVMFAHGGEEEFDVVIACDGIHSRTRQSTNLPTRITSTGEAYLRGVSDVPSPNSIIREIWGADGRRFGLAPLPKQKTYFYCSVPLGQWNDILTHRLTAWMESWNPYGPDVVSVLQTVPDWSTVNYDEIREVRLKRWYKPPIFIVGDAAHAMTPNYGQGANSAMVDAVVLMRLLSEAGAEAHHLESVGRTYQSLRQPLINRIQRASRWMGKLAAWRAPWARWVRDRALLLNSHVRWAHRRGMLLAAGYHPPEEEYLQ